MLPFQCTDFINALFEYLADERADIHVNTEHVRVLERFLELFPNERYTDAYSAFARTLTR